MKRKIIAVISGIVVSIAIINFAFAIYIYINDSKKASAEPIDFCSLSSSPLHKHNMSADINPDFEVMAYDSDISLEDHQLNRYNIARFLKELKLGTNINAYVFSQHLDILDIPYENIRIITDDINYDDLSKILAMSAVYTGYNVDNITHFENYARLLWAATHTITVNDNSYPARVIIDYADQIPAFYDDITSEYNNKGTVTFYFSPVTEDSYYSLDPASDFTWTDEKKNEAEQLRAMSYIDLVSHLLNKNAETVLYSPLPLFNQGGGTWCDVQFGGGTIRSDGCCPCAISMVVSYFKGERITPDVIAAMYDTDAYRNANSGSFGVAMCRQAAVDFGLNIEAAGDILTAEQIVSYLNQGCKIVISVKGYDAATGTGGDYSSGYHYITLAGMTSDGYVIVNNPGYATDITYDTAQKVAANQSGKCYAVFWN